MKLDKEQLKDYLDQNQFIQFRIYQGFVTESKISEKMPVISRVGKSIKEGELCNDQILTFFDQYQGQYTLVASNKNNTRINTHNKVYVENIDPILVEQITGEERSGAIDTSSAEFLDLVDQKVTAILEHKEQEKIRQEQQAKLEHLQTTSGMLSFFLNNLLEDFMKRNGMSLSGMMGSMSSGPGSPGSGSAVMNDQYGSEGAQELSDKDQERLEKALSILVGALGWETICKLAIKFNKGEADNLIPVIQNFANN